MELAKIYKLLVPKFLFKLIYEYILHFVANHACGSKIRGHHLINLHTLGLGLE
jgi:hypothetical protein